MSTPQTLTIHKLCELKKQVHIKITLSSGRNLQKKIKTMKRQASSQRNQEFILLRMPCICKAMYAILISLMPILQRHGQYHCHIKMHDAGA